MNWLLVDTVFIETISRTPECEYAETRAKRGVSGYLSLHDRCMKKRNGVC